MYALPQIPMACCCSSRNPISILIRFNLPQCLPIFTFHYINHSIGFYVILFSNLN
jgi:hypothetical protein